MDKIKGKINKYNILKFLFIIVSVLFAMPSIIYMITNKTILNFEPYFKFLLNDSDKLNQTLIYVILLSFLILFYVLLLKYRKKIFPNIKKMFIYIGIISLIFVLVVPFMCSDVFYYLGIGRIGSTYNQNPYETTIKDFVEQENNQALLEQDTVLMQGYVNDWADSTVVYGPVWTMICQIVAGLSFGNIDIALLLFKLVNVFVHLLNCYMIYKISNKKLFVLLYGLNPFVLIEGMSSVHNDMFVVLFVLISIYALIKKKNLVISVIFIALATAIKYFTILLLPFIIIYYFRKKNWWQRLLKCFQYGLLFIAVLIIPYLLYVQSPQVIAGLFMQQEKLAKSFYLILTEYFKEPTQIVEKTKLFLLGSFAIVYFFFCIVLIAKKKINWRKEMQIANYFIMAFLFFLITNFQPWYILWLFPLIMFQKAENIKWIVQIALIAELSNSIFLLNSEAWQNGIPYVFTIYVASFSIGMINSRMKKKKQIKTFQRKLEESRGENLG